MKKKALKLNKLSLNKERVAALEMSNVVGGVVSQVPGPSCTCSLVVGAPTCNFVCPTFANTCGGPSNCEPCQTGSCPALGC